MRGQFPPTDPYASGMPDVGDGHRMYWECCGNPAVRPDPRWSNSTTRYASGSKNRRCPGVQPEPGLPCRLRVLDEAGHGGEAVPAAIVEALAEVAAE